MLLKAISTALALGSRESAVLSLPERLTEDLPVLAQAISLSEPDSKPPRHSSSDCGYFPVYDSYRDRYIFVCTMEVGKDVEFLRAHGVQHFIDCTKEPEQHFYLQSSKQKQRNFEGIVTVIKLLISCEENVVIYCRNGRTRSPAFVAAYFTIVFCMSTKGAYCVLTKAYNTYRPVDVEGGIDRLSRYCPHIDKLLKFCDSMDKEAILTNYNNML